MSFDSRGQAFDVFKLLIAAVVALAMLAILMPILNNIVNIGTNDPGKTAGDLIKNNYNRPSDYTESNEVTFDNKANQLNAKTVAELAKQGLDYKQICFAMGDFAEGSGDFEFVDSENNTILKYVGGSTKKVKLGIVCDDGSSLQDSLRSQVESGSSEVNTELHCAGGGNGPTGSQTYCAIILRYA